MLRLLNCPHEPPHDFNRIGSQSLHVVNELAHVQFPLARLDFGDGRLRPSQPLRDLRLRPILLITQILQQLQEGFPLLRVERFGEALFQRQASNPKTGLSDFLDIGFAVFPMTP